MTTHFKLFDLHEDATEEQIKSRYKQLASRCHPDKGGSAELMVMIKNSYQKLMIGEGSLVINQPLDSSNKQVLALKKTIHQQQFYIQKLSVAVAKKAQQKETKQLQKVVFPAATSVLLIAIMILASNWYQSEKKLNALINQQPAPSIITPAPVLPVPNSLNPEQGYKTWELKQKLRLTSARQQYLESDLATSLEVIQGLLLNSNTEQLNVQQQQFLLQQNIALVPAPPLIAVNTFEALLNELQTEQTEQGIEQEPIEEQALDNVLDKDPEFALDQATSLNVSSQDDEAVFIEEDTEQPSSEEVKPDS
ncbi:MULTISPECIES: J domain-containing protein [unclassified Agarivorans]|uniref:J domain-containing protein n=1 Tax=unclassified Agarivorans TaxID=2636026 RepID=UPI0026E1AE67|nr:MULTISPECIES: J domain-containing protein [unclassified Agarivorans]MDO6684957.1 J domain-containing protein [Agarivorans sp. 3_MG-2023]MDO6714882.1 J domain-containing protein [Agarivorans sp. 2_MG-2023]